MRIKFLLCLILLNVLIFSQENTSENDGPIRFDETKLLINDGGNTPTNIDTTNTLGTQDLLPIIFVFIIVIGALYFVLKLIKKVGGNRIGLDNDLIHVISTKALKGTTALHLVEVGNQIFLIGATDSSVNSIAEITEKESKDMIALNLSTDNVPQTSFFKNFTDKLNLNNKVSGGDQATPTINTNKDKLNKY